MNSRYSKGYSSQCGDSIPRSGGFSSRYRDAATKCNKPVGDNYGAPSYVTKHRNEFDLGSQSKMDEEDISPQLEESQKPEIEELQYDNGEMANQEVLQESELDEFCQDTSTDEKETENDGLAIEVEQITPEPAENHVTMNIEENGVEQILPTPPSPACRTSLIQNENASPSSLTNVKKLSEGLWPPVENDGSRASVQKQMTVDDTHSVPKKRVSDLIARFNSGIVENEPVNKIDANKYKNEYGANKCVGKIQSNIFH